MIDLHSHMLPCVDDGSRSLENRLPHMQEAAQVITKNWAVSPWKSAPPAQRSC